MFNLDGPRIFFSELLNPLCHFSSALKHVFRSANQSPLSPKKVSDIYTFLDNLMIDKFDLPIQFIYSYSILWSGSYSKNSRWSWKFESRRALSRSKRHIWFEKKSRFTSSTLENSKLWSFLLSMSNVRAYFVGFSPTFQNLKKDLTAKGTKIENQKHLL